MTVEGSCPTLQGAQSGPVTMFKKTDVGLLRYYVAVNLGNKSNARGSQESAVRRAISLKRNTYPGQLKVDSTILIVSGILTSYYRASNLCHVYHVATG